MSTRCCLAGELHDATGRPQILDVGGSLACPSSAAVPDRQFRLNRALGVDLLPPDPADCLRIADAGSLAAALVRKAAHAAGVAPPRVVLRTGTGADRRHTAPLDDSCGRQG